MSENGTISINNGEVPTGIGITDVMQVMDDRISSLAGSCKDLCEAIKEEAVARKGVSLTILKELLDAQEDIAILTATYNIYSKASWFRKLFSKRLNKQIAEEKKNIQARFSSLIEQVQQSIDELEKK